MIEGVDIVKAAAFLSAGIAVAFGGLGCGLGEGYIAGKACEGIAHNPKESNLLTRTMLISMAVCESCAIYALVIALLLLFVVV